ncbi:MAG: Ca2+-binding protein toxin-related [Caulobacter sp.]|nr:Ca2+-binding protein toxin-related [Caulobacter sp.]
MPFAAVVELSALDGSNGFRLIGEAPSSRAGWSVASAGDVNGDGIDDLIIGAPAADPNGDNTGASYVVFGRHTAAAGGFAANLDLGDLDGTNGFRIGGAAIGGQSGRSVACAGDVNGDGIDDLIVGAVYADVNGHYSGASYVVFGRQTATVGGFAADLNLSALDGTNGFRLGGAASDDRSGWSVASAGDVNGDGVDDLIVGSPLADPSGGASGASYVVFGRDTAAAGAFAADLNLSALDGANGFRIRGAAAYSRSGISVASAGDINGDGIGDLVVGAYTATPNGTGSGASYVVFGKNTAIAGAFAADLALSDLNGSNGFRISGAARFDHSGISVASAGDINDDGIDDLIIGARYVNGDTGASYVVFGRNTATTGAFAADLPLSSLNGANGFRIRGAAGYDQAGFSVASAGDVDGDGIDDLIIGAKYADPHGGQSGASYVVFGRNTAADGAFGADLIVSALDGQNGFRINGVAAGDASGFSVASAGDINGDGLDDLIIGATSAGANGAGYVVFGQSSRVNFVGASGNDTSSGGRRDDTLSGLGGNDVLYGLGGDDLLDGGDLSDLLYGGDGADDLVGGGGGDILNGDDGNDELSGNDGADKLNGGAGADRLFGGSGNDRMGGEADIDTLDGGTGNDYLDGGFGADIMSGGTDNDVYIVDNAGDQTIEIAGEGYDIVRTAVDGWVLGANLEGLELQGSADIDGTGNGDANNLQGNAGANTLSGLAGVDTINGGDGDDLIIGGQNNDLLRGGLGADTFRVEHAFGGVLETDQIYDFSTAEGDRIDVSGAYAGTIARVAAFTHHAGEMTLTFAAGITTVRLDIDGNGVAEYQVRINGDVSGDWGGWLL